MALTESDKKLSKSAQATIEQATKDYADAVARGDSAAAQKAHDTAQAARGQASSSLSSAEVNRINSNKSSSSSSGSGSSNTQTSGSSTPVTGYQAGASSYSNASSAQNKQLEANSKSWWDQQAIIDNPNSSQSAKTLALLEQARLNQSSNDIRSNISGASTQTGSYVNNALKSLNDNGKLGYVTISDSINFDDGYDGFVVYDENGNGTTYYYDDKGNIQRMNNGSYMKTANGDIWEKGIDGQGHKLTAEEIAGKGPAELPKNEFANLYSPRNYAQDAGYAGVNQWQNLYGDAALATLNQDLYNLDESDRKAFLTAIANNRDLLREYRNTVNTARQTGGSVGATDATIRGLVDAANQNLDELYDARSKDLNNANNSFYTNWASKDINAQKTYQDYMNNLYDFVTQAYAIDSDANTKRYVADKEYAAQELLAQAQAAQAASNAGAINSSGIYDPTTSAGKAGIEARIRSWIPELNTALKDLDPAGAYPAFTSAGINALINAVSKGTVGTVGSDGTINLTYSDVLKWAKDNSGVGLGLAGHTAKDQGWFVNVPRATNPANAGKEGPITVKDLPEDWLDDWQIRN